MQFRLIQFVNNLKQTYAIYRIRRSVHEIIKKHGVPDIGYPSVSIVTQVWSNSEENRFEFPTYIIRDSLDKSNPSTEIYTRFVNFRAKLEERLEEYFSNESEFSNTEDMYYIARPDKASLGLPGEMIMECMLWLPSADQDTANDIMKEIADMFPQFWEYLGWS